MSCEQPKVKMQLTVTYCNQTLGERHCEPAFSLHTYMHAYVHACTYLLILADTGIVAVYSGHSLLEQVPTAQLVLMAVVSAAIVVTGSVVGIGSTQLTAGRILGQEVFMNSLQEIPKVNLLGKFLV